MIYKLPAVIAAAQAGETVYVVEGEKDVHAIEKAGAVATCNPGGAGKWRPEYSESLAGARVVIVADRDEPGLAHARTILESLAASAEPTIVQAAAGKDAADHLAAGCTLDDFVPLGLSSESEESATEQPSFSILVYSAKELAGLELPEPAHPLVGPFMRRGMETLVGGLTGHGKTTFIAQTVKAAALGGEFLGEHVAGGARVLVLDLEQHLHSIQRVIREAGLDDTDLVDYAPIPEGLALNSRSDQLDELERVLAAKPYDALVIDPFYKLHEADSSDELQARLLVALLRRWIKQFGFGILTATHCRKLPAGRNYITLDDLFGSSLFTRDPELVLGIQRHKDLTKLHVFKSREPGLERDQVFELLYTRERGFWVKPTTDPEERRKKLEAAGAAAAAYIEENPGESTNSVKKHITGYGSDLVEEALSLQVKSGLLPEPLRGSRNAKLWYPHNHATLTSPQTLLGEVTEGLHSGQSRDDFTRPSDLYVVEEGRAGEVDEAELERLADLGRDPNA